jgi:transposase
MEHCAGIDVSLDTVSVCVVDGAGKVLREAKAATEPEALVRWFRGLGFVPERVGREAGPLSQWLRAGMREKGLPVEGLETRHVRTAFKAMPVKTDRKDARGIAQLVRMGWFRPVHRKSLPAQETRALLTTRKLVLSKRIDMEMGLRGILRGFGLKISPTTPRTFEARVRALVEGPPDASRCRRGAAFGPDRVARPAEGVERRLVDLARDSKRARLLMSAPGVGVIVALTYVSAIDDPGRFRSSKAVGPHFGLTPKRYQSGETDVTGRIEDRRCGRPGGALRGRQRDPDPAGEGIGAQELGRPAGRASRDAQGQSGAGPQAGGDLLDTVAKSAVGFVHTIARASLRRGVPAATAAKSTSRSGPTRPVRDGGCHGQARQGTPTAQA